MCSTQPSETEYAALYNLIYAILGDLEVHFEVRFITIAFSGNGFTDKDLLIDCIKDVQVFKLLDYDNMIEISNHFPSRPVGEYIDGSRAVYRLSPNCGFPQISK